MIKFSATNVNNKAFMCLLIVMAMVDQQLVGRENLK